MKKILSLAFIVLALALPAKASLIFTNTCGTNELVLLAIDDEGHVGQYTYNEFTNAFPPITTFPTNVVLAPVPVIYVPFDNIPFDFPWEEFDFNPTPRVDYTNGMPPEVSFPLNFAITYTTPADENYTEGTRIVGLSLNTDLQLWATFYLADTRFPYARPPEE